MPALVAGIHVLLGVQAKTWMAGTSPAMTSEFVSPSRLQAHHLILATCPVRVLQIYAPNIEGAGKAGCRADTHSPVCKIKSTRVSRHRCAGTPGFPCAMVLTVSFVLSLVIGLCCHHCRLDCGSNLRQRERQRRGVRTTRLRRPLFASLVLRRQSVHRIPPNVRDDGQRPSYRGGTREALSVICPMG
jgi:hypothetical protein